MFPINKFIDSQILSVLLEILINLDHEDNSLLKEQILWIFINVVYFDSGYSELIKLTEDSKKNYNKIFDCLINNMNSNSLDVKLNVLWLTYNLIQKKFSNIEYFIQNGL